MTASGSGLHVYKFGGSSLGDAARIRRAAALVAERRPPPVVVVSAMAGVTDRLSLLSRGAAALESGVEELRGRHHRVLEELGPPGPDRTGVARALDLLLDGLLDHLRDGPPPALPDTAAEAPPGTPERIHSTARLDRILATGEDLSTHLMAFALRARGQPARVVDAREVVRTDARFGRARPDDDAVRERAGDRLAPLPARGIVPVVQGFVGATPDGRTTTLGRGGSDYTAAILGAALAAERVHVWTDVDGMLSGDPRTVEEPRVLARMGFEEAVELSYFGARVLHPAAAKHAVSQGVPLQIRNTFRPDGPGTLILQDRRVGPRIVAVAYKPSVVLIKVRSRPAALPYGFLARVFEILARHRLPVDLVATSHSSTAFTIDENEEIDVVSRELGVFADVEIVRSLATITVVGRGLLEEPGVDGLVFREVGTTPIQLISQASDVSLSFLVAAPDAPRVVRRLHDALVRGDAAEDAGPAADPGSPKDPNRPEGPERSDPGSDASPEAGPDVSPGAGPHGPPRAESDRPVTREAP